MSNYICPECKQDNGWLTDGDQVLEEDEEIECHCNTQNCIGTKTFKITMLILKEIEE